MKGGQPAIGGCGNRKNRTIPLSNIKSNINLLSGVGLPHG